MQRASIAAIGLVCTRAWGWGSKVKGDQNRTLQNLRHDRPIGLFYLSDYLTHLPLRLFTYLSGYHSPVSDFFILQIEFIVQVCYTPQAWLAQ